MAKASQQGLSGRQKAAILLITLGPEVSAQIFKHLRDEEIEQLTLEIANVRKVDSGEKESIMSEFHQICLAQEYISQGGINYAKEILEKALGSAKALEVINRLTATLQVRPLILPVRLIRTRFSTSSRTRMYRLLHLYSLICNLNRRPPFCLPCLRRSRRRWPEE